MRPDVLLKHSDGSKLAQKLLDTVKGSRQKEHVVWTDDAGLTVSGRYGTSSGRMEQ
jgi:hypothetical protein